MAGSTLRIPYGRLLLLSISNLLLLIIAMGVGVIVYKETTMQQIVCPDVVQGERFVQSMTDGKELICVYSVTPPMNKKIVRKSGQFK